MFIQEIILPKEKDEAYVINLDEYESIETHWIALYMNGNNIFWYLWCSSCLKGNYKIQIKQNYYNKYL